MLSQALLRADSIARHFETVFLFTKADVRTTLIPVVCHGDNLCPSYESYSPVHFRPYSHWLRHRHITSASPCMPFSGYGSIYCSSISQIRFRIRKRTARTSHPVRYLLVGFLWTALLICAGCLPLSAYCYRGGMELRLSWPASCLRR